ncbi:MAG: peptidylprolyl isomerase [Halanaerobiales bacterium]|nr:peptidylprolyl isomerase [Halanaerobiales bacterium]
MKSKKLITTFVILILVLSISIVSFAQESNNSNKIVATVNGNDITSKELNQSAGINQFIMSIYKQNRDFAQVLLKTEPGKNLMQKYKKNKLNDLIKKRLIIQEAKKRNISISDKQKEKLFKQHLESIKKRNQINDKQLKQALNKQGIKSLDQYQKVFLQNNKDSFLINKLRNNVTKDVSVSENKIKEYYNNNKKNFKVEEQVKVSQILIKTEQKSTKEVKNKINTIKNKLNNGENFSTLAKKYSEGPYAEKGGNIGFIKKETISKIFGEKVFNLKIDEISEPIKVNNEYRIVKINDKKEAGIKPFKEVKNTIKSQLENNKKSNQWQEFVKKLENNANITIKL